MKRFFRVMAGPGSVFAADARDQGFIGTDWFAQTNLADRLPDNWRAFNKEFIPQYLVENPGRSKVAAGLACGFTWTVAKGFQLGDIILTPNGNGQYFVGEIVSEYEFALGKPLPHRRRVAWYPDVVSRSAMSQELRNSTGAAGTVAEVSRYAAELESLISSPGVAVYASASRDDDGDEIAFALEAQLQQFLVANWQGTDLGKEYDIFEEDGVQKGVEYQTDTGRIDILAIKKDGSELLVVELKRGRVSDKVVGQIQRYMGYAVEELAEPNQAVRGVIIGFEDDLNLRRALVVAPNIDFYRYEVKFKLIASKR